MNPQKIRFAVLVITAIVLLCNSGILSVNGEEEEAEGEAEEGETGSATGSSETKDSSSEPVCSVSEVDASQTCISIKFPWKEDSVYFCTDNKKITYSTKCGENHALSICNHDNDKEDLKISTPWDCCPFVSKPNRCEDEVCPEVPFNRTCTSSKLQHECCPRYFCEKGDATKCKLQMSKASCVNPPKGKTNCTAFIDPYGCCKKFQCAGEGKAGDCPPKPEKSHFLHKVMDGMSHFLDGDLVKSGKKMFHVNNEEQKCTGDYTCPGTMKCCPTYSMIQKMKAKKDKTGKSKGGKATPIVPADGICMKPINLDTNEEEGSKETEKETEKEDGKEKEDTETETAAESPESNTHAEPQTRDQTANENPISAL